MRKLYVCLITAIAIAFAASSQSALAKSLAKGEHIKKGQITVRKSTSSSRDVSTGQASGRRQWGPAQIKK